ncbi:unnamed protein product [Chondrus crispus]|uniref:Uncharacterized protein n=1 Tax=Chondrus crispus TaxID=2769 RepID=R7QLL0_CHOCR|nr:unnamed protein product [Chondrus crispus]CDF38290.1 unnamed protein product [Chondrus crispus]|eukprot:XP_005718175.1 unnamed protein product [Chondrus crispus]
MPSSDRWRISVSADDSLDGVAICNNPEMDRGHFPRHNGHNADPGTGRATIQDLGSVFLSPDDDSAHTNDVVDIIGRISSSDPDDNPSDPLYYNPIDEDCSSSDDMPSSQEVQLNSPSESEEDSTEMNLPVNMRVEQAEIISLHSPSTHKGKTVPTNQFYGQKNVIQDYFSCLFTYCESELVNVNDTDLNNDEAVEASLTSCASVEGEDRWDASSDVGLSTWKYSSPFAPVTLSIDTVDADLYP